MTPTTYRPPAVESPDRIISRALDEVPLSDREVLELLKIRDGAILERLFSAARRLRERYFGNRLFLYGFLYASTHCRNHCRFCLYRRGNSRAPRYRKSAGAIIDSARRLAESGVHLIDLTMGEDPLFFQDGGDGYDDLLDILQRLIAAVDRPVMVSPGVIPEAVLHRFVRAGVRWYACYQETHNRELFSRLREGQDYDRRWQIKRAARQAGLLIEEGLLCGVGESAADIVASLSAIDRLKADQVRVMTFIPQPGTPMGRLPAADPLTELKITALMRLRFPKLLIPASMDVGGHDGLRQRLDAGANVVTSLVPPGQDLVGVARSRMDIEEGRRTVEGIGCLLDLCGLAPASSQQFEAWMQQRSDDGDPVRSKRPPA